MFPSITYRDWRRRQVAEAEADLVSTSLNRPQAASDGIVPGHLCGLEAPATDRTVRDLLAREYGLPLDRITVTGRCQHANFLVTAAVRDRYRETGGENPRALVESPAYQPLAFTPVGFGFDVDRFERPPDDDYAVDVEAIAKRLTEETALVILTNRHNPSGRVTDPETLESVSRLAAERDVIVLVDEVYAPFVTRTPDAPRTAFGGASCAGLENIVVTNSLTKFHGLYDVNTGWVVAEPDILERVRRIEDHTNVVARPNREMARRALAHTDLFRECSRELLSRRHEQLSDFVERRDDVHGTVRPDATFAFVKHAQADGNAVDDRAMDEGVMVTPGRFFDDPWRFRISVGHGRDANRDALQRLDRALDDL